MFKASERQLDLVQLLWNCTTAYLGITHLTTDMCAINMCSINNFFVHAYIVEICDQTVFMDVTLACEFLCMDSHLTIFVITDLPTIAVMRVHSQNTILSAVVKWRPPLSLFTQNSDGYFYYTILHSAWFIYFCTYLLAHFQLSIYMIYKPKENHMLIADITMPHSSLCIQASLAVGPQLYLLEYSRHQDLQW